MKKNINFLLLFIIFGVFFNSGSATAQLSPTALTLDNLKTPDAPGFALLGVSPTNIDKPTTPKSLMLSLENITNNNYAMEVAPYWLFDHPQVPIDKYFNPGFGQCLLQNLTVSVASAPVSNEFNATSNAMGQGMGIGLRTLLFQGQESKALISTINDMTNVQDNNWLLAHQKGDAGQMAVIAKAIDADVTKAQSEESKPVGFIMELATAEVINLSGSDFSQATASSFGIWVTPSIGFETDETMNLQLLGRFISDQLNSQNYIDFGGSFTKSWGNTQASAEFIERGATNNNSNTFRAVLAIYGPIQNNLYWSASFGKNFNTINNSGAGNYVSLFGIKLGVGPEPNVSLNKQ